MGDHGPDAYIDWDHLETTPTLERFATLFAARTPGFDHLFGDGPTPVNLIPTLLNTYAGTELPTHSDDSFRGYPPRQALVDIGNPDEAAPWSASRFRRASRWCSGRSARRSPRDPRVHHRPVVLLHRSCHRRPVWWRRLHPVSGRGRPLVRRRSVLEPYQLAGPYEVRAGDVLYPPVALLLFVPFVVLPAVLWWVIPLSLTGWSMWRLRPSPPPGLLSRSVFGIRTLGSNCSPGIRHLVCRGARARDDLRVAGRLRSLEAKPGSACPVRLADPFLVARPGGPCEGRLLFLPMWPDFIRVVLNAQHPSGALYSLGEVPMMLIPLAAWIARR